MTSDTVALLFSVCTPFLSACLSLIFLAILEWLEPFCCSESGDGSGLAALLPSGKPLVCEYQVRGGANSSKPMVRGGAVSLEHGVPSTMKGRANSYAAVATTKGQG